MAVSQRHQSFWRTNLPNSDVAYRKARQSDSRFVPNHLEPVPKKARGQIAPPDGSPCTGVTQGLLGRTKIVAGRLIPVGKETDRRWEQGEDPSMLDPSIHIYETQKKMCVADLSDRRRWRQIGVRNGMRRSGLSQKAVFCRSQRRTCADCDTRNLSACNGSLNELIKNMSSAAERLPPTPSRRWYQNLSRFWTIRRSHGFSCSLKTWSLRWAVDMDQRR